MPEPPKKQLVTLDSAPRETPSSSEQKKYQKPLCYVTTTKRGVVESHVFFKFFYRSHSSDLR